MKYYILVFYLFFTTPILADVDVDDLTPKEQACYAKAMIGFDSVINSRLGLLPEHGVSLTGFGTNQNDFYLEAILGAYLWKKSPHKYAVKTFLNCIKTLEKITFIK
jgi:hypothetical protein